MEKADTKVVYEKGKPEKFTNFELLQAEVDVLKDTIDKIVEILRTNDISMNQKIEAEYFNYDKVFEGLEE